MSKVIVIGSSGHARSIIEAIERSGEHTIIGLLDDFKEVGSESSGYKIIGKIDDIVMLMNEHGTNKAIIGIGSNWNRGLIKERLNNIIIEYITVIHPSSEIAHDTHIGTGSFIGANTVINVGSYIGDHCVVNTGAILEHDNILQDLASVATGVVTGGHVHIGRSSFIGLNSTIKNTVTIGEHTVVGAGSLVLGFISGYKTCYGSPCKEISDRKKEDDYL